MDPLIFQVRWGDKHGGYGEQYWEYNHGPSKHHVEPHYKEAKYEPAPPKYPGVV